MDRGKTGSFSRAAALALTETQGHKPTHGPTLLYLFRIFFSPIFATKLTNYVASQVSPVSPLSSGEATTFNLTANIHFPLQEIIYSPAVSEVLFDAWVKYYAALVSLRLSFFPCATRCIISSVVLSVTLVLSINLIHCGNEFRNSVPVRALGL